MEARLALVHPDDDTTRAVRASGTAVTAAILALCIAVPGGFRVLPGWAPSFWKIRHTIRGHVATLTTGIWRRVRAQRDTQGPRS